MELCASCFREVFNSRTCIARVREFVGDATHYIPIRYGDDFYWLLDGETEAEYRDSRPVVCHDCGVVVGGTHHNGCFNEECPKCHTQAVSCDCEEVE